MVADPFTQLFNSMHDILLPSDSIQMQTKNSRHDSTVDTPAKLQIKHESPHLYVHGVANPRIEDG